MKVTHLLGAAGAILILTTGATLAAEACACCKDMAAGTAMDCCDKPAADSPAPSQPAHVPPAAPDGPAPQTPGHQ
jgi:hypothetical protein